MQLAIFSDEINPGDPQRAVELAREWGVSHVEVRNLPVGRFPRAEDAALGSFGACISDAGLRVSAVSPGFFKCSVHHPSVDQSIAEGLPKACEWALKWGTGLLSEFGFTKSTVGPIPTRVVDRLGEVADRVQSEGCGLTLENVAGCWGDTGTQAAELIRAVGAERLSLCWDPGSAARAGSRDPFPGEYEGIKDLVTHVHVKNYIVETGAWGLLDTGLVDWAAYVGRLRSDGYEGFLVVETHLKERTIGIDDIPETYSDLEANTYQNWLHLRKYAADQG